jgi:DNA-binding ferritin-like protein
MTQFVSLRTIGDAVTMTAPQAMATQLLADLEALLRTLNSAFDASSAENQQGIANFVAERIDATQKWIWQLRSSVGMQKASGEVGINHA